MSKRRKTLLAALIALLLATTGWSWSVLADSRADALRCGDELARCVDLADRIQTSKARPVMAADQERLATETTGLIESAARQAGMGAGNLVRISPEAPRRVDESPYKQKPTRIFMKKVSLKQLVGMVHRLGQGPSPLVADSLRLTAPEAGDTGDLWAAELVLTYLIYDPPNVSR